MRLCVARRLITFCLLAIPALVDAQVTASIRGRVIGAQSDAPVAGASVALADASVRTETDAEGRFVLVGVPPGERAIRVERIGYRAVVIEGIVVSLGRTSQVDIELTEQAVTVEGVTVEAERIRLIEPTVSATHEVLIARELRALPVDRIEEVLELTPGVSGGHFRGGRVGQEVYVVDGLEVKNQLEASLHGFGLELPPSALEEVEVITGGVGASFGAALSGVVSYVTRRGSTEQWEGSASLLTDAWIPDSEFRGFNGVAVSGGGPLRFLGDRATLRIDALAHGMEDADPRSRGLACLDPSDAPDDLAARMHEIDMAAPGLRCPSTDNILPHQQGDRMIGFVRFDRPVAANTNLTLSFLRSRQQRELYTPAFRYSDGSQLGQRTKGTLARLGVDWTGARTNGAARFTLRVALLRLDRYLGALDPAAIDGRTTIGGFGFSDFRFLGESAARRPIEAQLSNPAPLPGYAAAGGIDSPFGPAGESIFFTEGTPDIANWTRSDAFAVDAVAERITANGSIVRAGAGTRLYRVESYQRSLSHLAGSSPSYARFYPATVNGFVDVRIAGEDELNLTGGIRFEAFRSGVRFQRDRADFLSPVLDPDWQFAVMPRLGLALPLPGTNGRTALRLSYGMVAQAPDFRFFLDSTIGDSLRTDVQRQGNPELSFERARAYEVGVSQLIGEHVGIAITAFRKDLRELASGALRIGSSGKPQYSTNDFGKVQGVEVSARGTWTRLAARAGYSLQKATGIASGTDADSVITGDPIERPLAFDQRHTIDVALLYGRAAGDPLSAWSAALTSTTRSGYPRDRLAASGDTVLPGDAYMPWTSTVDLRVARELGTLPGCAQCSWRVTFDGRNLLGRDNVLATRRETGSVAPTLAMVEREAARVATPSGPIPAESPFYTHSVDANGDGSISLAEFDLARTAAALDRFDPSLFYGEPRQLRLGIEVSF